MFAVKAEGIGYCASNIKGCRRSDYICSQFICNPCLCAV